MDAGLIGLAIVLLIGLFVYLIPTMVAFRRRHPSRWLVLIANLLFGATGIGWFLVLIWAAGEFDTVLADPPMAQPVNIIVSDDARVRVAQNLPALPQSSDDPHERLRRLKALHDDGTINDTEFEHLRKPLLRALGLF